jgi:AcrR family transcriptional regulator
MPIAGKTKQAALSEFRCSEILGAARKVFAKKGFNGATMDDIASAAGVAKGTLYLYFKSKRDVYLKTIRHGRAELLKQVTANMEAAPCLRDKIRTFISTRVRYSEAHRDFYKIYLTEFDNIIHGASSAGLRELHLKQARLLEQALRESMERSEIRPVKADVVAFAIQDMTRSLIARRLLASFKSDVEEDSDFLCDLIWNGIGR